MASALFSPKNSSSISPRCNPISMSNRIGELIGLLFQHPDRLKRISPGQKIEPFPEKYFFLSQ